MRQAIWSPEARRDLDDIADYIGADNPFAARRVVERIEAAIDKLKFMPSGRPGRVAGTHERPVRGLPYIIAFELPDAETLHILRIVHGARDWPQGGWPED